MNRWPTLTALAAICLLVGGGCDATGDDEFRNGVEPLEVTATAPTYAVAVGRELVVRSGSDQSLIPARHPSVQWLPAGGLLLNSGNDRRLRLVEPSTGRDVATTATRAWDFPSFSVTQVNLLKTPSYPTPRLVTYSVGLEPGPAIKLPPTDNPEADAYNELARNYFGAVVTVDGATFVQWHDSSEWYEGGDAGFLRIEDGEQRNVLVNERIVGLHLSVDGGALLAVQQRNGEPCGGCVVSQDILEVDPATGDITADYGVPDGYDKWRVEAIDKVGDRVAVRYSVLDGTGGPRSAHLIGTYVHEDGEWSLLPGSDEAVTWWQDGGQVVAKVKESEPLLKDGYELFWTDGTSMRPVQGELIEGSVAGRLLPPQA